jgi:hypothetical protein
MYRYKELHTRVSVGIWQRGNNVPILDFGCILEIFFLKNVRKILD